jgi:L-tartrate/succinate antiporter
MKPSWRYVAPLFMWLAIVLIPHPAGLSQNGWNYLGLFAGVVVALVLEPLPPAAVGLIGVTTATMLGLVIPKPADAIKWG